MDDKFYIVMRDRLQNTINKWHPTKEEAMEEAERLCRQERARFYVLEVISYVEVEEIPVKWTEK